MNTKCVSLSLLCFFLLIAILSCENSGPAVNEPNHQNENVLRYDVSIPLAALNPVEVDGTGSTYIFPFLYSYLFVPDKKGVLQPDLAVKWTYDSNTFIWTIHLRKDAFFHDHRLVSSQDVAYTFNRLIKKNFSSYFLLIKQINSPSDNIVRFHLSKHDPGFLQKIWDQEIIPYDEDGKTDFVNHPIGSGPFRFVYRKSSTEVGLEANAGYYKGRPSLDGVVFFFQPDKEKTWTRILSGKTDIAVEITPKNYEIMRQYEKQYYFDLYTVQYYTLLLYNIADPLFSNVVVRRALSHAIDREYIIQDILRGFGKVAVGPMGVDSPYRNPDIKPIPYIPKKSLDLLREAGWEFDPAGQYLEKDGKPFEFTIFFIGENRVFKKVAQYIKLCFSDIGIKVHLRSISFNELTKRYFRANDFQAVLTEPAGAYRIPEILKEMWTPNGAEKAMAGAFEHPEVTRLIHKALQEKDPLKQKELYHEVDALITLLQPGTFLYQKTVIDVMSKRFKLKVPFSLTLAGIYRLKEATLQKQ